MADVESNQFLQVRILLGELKNLTANINTFNNI